MSNICGTGTKVVIKALNKDGVVKFKGRVFVYKGVDFGIVDEGVTLHEIIHINSGCGFSGNGKRNLDSIKAAEKRIGAGVFWKAILSKKTITEGLEEVERDKEHNSFVFEEIKALSKKTGLQLRRDTETYASRRWIIDVFDLEKQLFGLGYTDGCDSVGDFITKKWDKCISNRIQRLI